MRNIKSKVLLLLLMSAVVYGIQLLIFHDPNTTEFYILQDIAFLPISIAVATVVIGQYVDSREKQERREKTQMLTSTFFTEIGIELLELLLPLTTDKETVNALLDRMDIDDDKTLDELRPVIRQSELPLKADEKSYETIRNLIIDRREILLIISSNPLLLDHEDFTKLLWALFHLLDEFRLRGTYTELSDGDLAHMEHDLEELLKLLLTSWARNVLFTKRNYPSYYNASLGKLKYWRQ
ncbi:MAG: hypothetical protein Q4B09_02645 [Lachnospiraceae bacterium]|nr:hypothetical protein [Lachnospiraceae bacterium]